MYNYMPRSDLQLFIEDFPHNLKSVIKSWWSTIEEIKENSNHWRIFGWKLAISIKQSKP